MRISDARYHRDLRRYQLAWRLIRHEARTRTVERWSGLSMYCIRTLYKAYASDVSGKAPSPPRGVAPFRINYFWRSARLRCESAVMAGFLEVFDVFPSQVDENAPAHLAGIARGERLCRAYEEFQAYLPTTQITLEHAILLLTELSRGVEIGVGRCTRCDILILLDHLAIGPRRCAYCAYELTAGLPYVPPVIAASAGSDTTVAGQELSNGPQSELF